MLADAGVRLAGRLEGFAGGHALFGPGLGADIADADARLARLLRPHRRPHRRASRRGMRFRPPSACAPIRCAVTAPAPWTCRPRASRAIVWATGYRRHFPWLRIPDVAGDDGGIVHDRGRTAVPGLYVLGMRWQSRMTSHQIGGVGPDAAVLAAQITAGDGRRALRTAA